MVTWFAGACVLLSPIEGIQPVEEVTRTPPPAQETTSQPSPVSTPTTPVQVPVWSLETRTLDGNPAQKTILVYVQYPFLQTNSSDADMQNFNETISRVISESIDSFASNLPSEPTAKASSEESLLNTFLGGYTIHHSSTGLLSLTLDFSQYVSGAAHPLFTTRSINYDFRQHRALGLGDLFQPGSHFLEPISELAGQELTQREMLFYKEGIAPNEENFHTWELSKEGLTIGFDPYQVAPYASCPPQVVIALDQIQDFLQPAMLTSINTPSVFLDATSAPIEYPKTTQTH